MARRSFSFLLARRYLNPRRSMLSSFSIISLIGVLLGVLVLVVVMAVYAGMERDVKSRLLGFTPHILLMHRPVDPAKPNTVSDWRKDSEPAKLVTGVDAVAPFVSDNVILDVDSTQKPVMFQAIDTEDPSQVERITRMLDRDHYPDSSADMGLDDRVVISSTLAEQFGIGVGQTVRFYSTRNFEQVMAAYKVTEKPPVRVAFAEKWKKANDLLAQGWKKRGDSDTIPSATLQQSYDLFNEIWSERIREPEKQMLQGVLDAMSEAERDEANGVHVFSKESREHLDQGIAELDKTDSDKMDGEILKGLKEVVLPKEALVVGVYQASQMTLTPEVFMPLTLAQTVSGLGDSVQGISVRLSDPYKAEEVAKELSVKMGPEWKTLTWMQQYSAFFSLINQQRMMMYFALSFIVLVSAFSMMAVMFTVTIQKRREIGVMKALGATSGQIVRVFVYQGMILGFFGAALGVGLGRVVIHYRGALQDCLRQLGFDPFTSSFTGFTILPAYNDPKEQVVFAFMAFLLCSFAALVPAFFAARSDAAKSLRNL